MRGPTTTIGGQSLWISLRGFSGMPKTDIRGSLRARPGPQMEGPACQLATCSLRALSLRSISETLPLAETAFEMSCAKHTHTSTACMHT